MYSCQHESAFFNFPLSAVFGDDVFFFIVPSLFL
jgi:hypothetical protein